MNALHASTPTVERALDVDSHEMVPVELRDEIFGATELHAEALSGVSAGLRDQFFFENATLLLPE
jgi:hypothetical protein